MQFYNCKVLNLNGEVIYKKIFAEESTNLFDLFKKSDLLLISATNQKSLIRNPITNFTLPFFKNLSQLVNNKIELIDALKIIANLFKNEEEQLIIETIIQQICLGMNLSQALSKFGRYFDKLSLKSIEVSEKTAELPKTIERIVTHISENLKLQNKIKEVMRYPIILIIFISIAIIFWFFILVPKFVELFYELNIELPFITRVIVSISKFVTKNSLFILMGIIILFVIVQKYRWHIFKIPFFYKIKRNVRIYNFCVAMETMLYDKVNLIEALECFSDIMPEIINVINEIKTGTTLSRAISKFEILDEYELSIISAGEKAGDLCSAFKSASDILRNDIENLSQKIISMIQPIAIISLGLLLIICVYALIVPLYSNLDIQ